MRTLLAALTIVWWLAVPGIGLAQTREPPVPIWPGGDQAPPNLNGYYVYWDSFGWQAVVVLTGDLQGTPGAPVKVVRVPFHNRFDIHLAASVTLSEGKYSYLYSVQNGGAAKDPVTSWSLVTPCEDQLTIAQQNSHCGKAGIPAAPQVLLPHIKKLACYATCFDDTPIVPGSPPTQLSISSVDLPGMVTFSAGNYPPFEVPRDWPDVIREQLSLLGALAWSNQQFPTIGPRFAPGTPTKAIVADFQESIKDLIAGGYLRTTRRSLRNSIALSTKLRSKRKPRTSRFMPVPRQNWSVKSSRPRL
ncbi:MAG: hypothetical protein ACRD30_09685 [Bryobacteraceae bacterium]